MFEEEIITPESLPQEAPNVPSGDGQVADISTESISLAEISAALGKTFPDKATALKAWKDTNSYVGSLGQKVKTLESQVPQVDQSERLASLEKATQEFAFYAQNPEYNTPEAKALIAKFGGNPAEVVQDEIFKTAYGAIKTQSEAEKTKSVLHSNPRLGQVQDKMTQAREAAKAGDSAIAGLTATQAVMDAYGIGTEN